MTKLLERAFEESLTCPYGSTAVDLRFVRNAVAGDGANVGRIDNHHLFEEYRNASAVERENWPEEKELPDTIESTVLNHPQFTITVDLLDNGCDGALCCFFCGDVEAADAWLTRNMPRHWSTALNYFEVSDAEADDED